MSYELQAIIARGELLAEVTQTLPNTVIAALEQGLALVPITDAFFDGVSVAVTRVDLGFWRLPTGFERILAAWSLRGPVAYVEAEYFGGVGWQRAALWSNGAVVLGPVSVEEHAPFAPEGSPISQALRSLGAIAGAGRDEFSTVGLGRKRHCDDWAVTGSGPDNSRPSSAGGWPSSTGSG